MTAPVSIRRAAPSDIGFIMATERREGYDALVGHWNEERHRATRYDPNAAVFIAERGGEPVGFAILSGWDSAERRTLIRRIAVAHPGDGIGTLFVQRLLAELFDATAVHRVTIGTFPENIRARRCYERAGFIAEGVARDAVFFDGRFRDELILSILRPEWESRGR